MSNRPVYLTREGYEALEQELHFYKVMRRQEDCRTLAQRTW